MRRPSNILLLTLLGLVAACDSTDPGGLPPEYVVEAILVSDEPLPPIRLSRTTGVTESYDFSRLAVRDATVALHPMKADGSMEEYREDPEQPGLYLPASPAARAQPLETYRLEVLIPETGASITGTTVVPDTFGVVNATLQRAVYQTNEQLEITVTRSSVPGRSQNYYIFVTESLDPREDQLTPIGASILDAMPAGVDTIEDLRVRGSPLLNENNYAVNSDGTLTIRYPWIGTVFFGPNRISINALDDNLYDFFRSQSVQQGGSTFAPGEIPNPLEPVRGAHGVFGSYARVTVELEVLRPGGL